MDDIDAAFDDAYRTNRIEAGDDPSTLPNPYARPSLTDPPSKDQSGSKSTSADTGGGFIVDDDNTDPSGGGGFMVDDDNAAANAGGFLPAEDNEDASSSQTSKIVKPNAIPLSAIPEALANLGLDSSDPSVLSLFADTAYVPSSASRRRLAPGVKPEKVVGRQEFQQVASVLVEEMQSRGSSKRRRIQDVGDEDEEEEAGSSSRRRPTRRAAVQGRKKAAEIIDQDDDGGGGGFIVDDEDNSEDDFEASRQRRRSNQSTALDTGSDLSSEGDDEDAELRDSATRRRRRAPRANTSPDPSLPSDTDSPKRRRNRKSPTATIRSTTHLNPNQRLSAQTLFSHLLSHLPSSPLPLPQRRLGTAELTAILTSLGEKLPPKEVEEMLEEASKLFAPATEEKDGGTGERRSNQAIRGAAAAQGIEGASVGLDEFAGVLVHNRLL